MCICTYSGLTKEHAHVQITFTYIQRMHKVHTYSMYKRTQTTHRQITRFALLEALVLMKVVLRYSIVGCGALSAMTLGVLLMQL